MIHGSSKTSIAYWVLDEFRLDSKTMRHDGSGKVIVSFVFDLSSVACMEDTYCLIKLILQVVW